MAKVKAKAKRRAKAARKVRRKAVPAVGATEPQPRAVPGPQENPRRQEDIESVQDPLEDWPEEADGEEDRWVVERPGEDVESPGDR